MRTSFFGYTVASVEQAQEVALFATPEVKAKIAAEIKKEVDKAERSNARSYLSDIFSGALKVLAS